MTDSTLKNANILIIDDQQTNIDVLIDLLEFKEYTNLKTTTDSRLAVSLFQEFNPDLVLLDLMMPNLNGYQVMEQLKSLIPDGEYLPILVLTADVNPSTKQIALAGGARDFLSKPFDLIEVELRIKNLLETRFLHLQLENQNKILEGKVKERTAVLKKTNALLILANEQANEMNRVKSFFLSNMSHELRTPLIAVMGFAQILEDDLSDPAQLILIRHIAKGGERLSNTLNSILELTSIEDQKSSKKLFKFNLKEEIERIVPSFFTLSDGKNLYLKTEFLDKDLFANIERELFERLLFHLVANAVKFTKQGGVIITLERVQKDNIDWGVIKINDSGIGISKKDYEKIFGEFRQSSEGYSRSHEGAGLGLTISKQIVEIMGGAIQVESKIGQGSVFSIWLPAVLDEEEIAVKIKEKSSTARSELVVSGESGLLQILSIEDNHTNRLLYKQMLAKLANIFEAADGFTAINIASERRFDLIMMDINLGYGIDGVETMRQIRKLPAYANTPIIAVTAYAMPGDRDYFLEQGFDEYLKKPFKKNQLLQLIQNVVGKFKH